MEEYKEVMGTNWAENLDNLFENLSPQQAMDKLKTIVSKGGDEAVMTDPKSLQLIRSIANITDNDIGVWMRKWIPHKMPKNHFNAVDELVKDYREKCRTALGLEPYKTRIN